MNLKKLFIVSLFSFPLSVFADSYYCPKNHMYVNTGMTLDQVLANCGEPLEKQTGENTKIEMRVPVKQLLYSRLNQGSIYPGLNAAFYDQWSLPSGSTGINVEVDIINNKVSAIKINSTDANSFTLCGGNNIVVGDDEVRVYNACGSPSMVNDTFAMKQIPASQKPEVWTYQEDQYHPVVRLTFVNGTLQFINK